MGDSDGSLEERRGIAESSSVPLAALATWVWDRGKGSPAEEHPALLEVWASSSGDKAGAVCSLRDCRLLQTRYGGIYWRLAVFLHPVSL